MNLPFFKLFVHDFGNATKHLSAEELGVYMRMLCLCWETNGCSFPYDIKLIRKRCLIRDNHYDGVVEEIIDEFFTIEDDRIFQKRLLAEYEKAKTDHEKNVKNGKLGADIKKKNKALKNKEKSSSPPKAPLKHGLSDPEARLKQLEPELEPELEVDNNNICEVKFAEFWDAYPNRSGGNPKKTAKDKFVKICKDGVSPDDIIIGAKKYAKANQDRIGTPYIAQATTWLNQERWLDDYEIQKTSKLNEDLEDWL